MVTLRRRSRLLWLWLWLWVGGTPYVYEVRAPGGIDVNDSLGPMSPFPSELEVAFTGGVPARCVVGCVMPNGDWLPNPDFGNP